MTGYIVYRLSPTAVIFSIILGGYFRGVKLPNFLAFPNIIKTRPWFAIVFQTFAVLAGLPQFWSDFRQG